MKKRNTDLRTYLYRLLSGRPYTRREVVERLARGGADRNEAVTLADEFCDIGLIDDETYARLFVEGHDSWGNDRIRYELRRRGVDDDTIASALSGGDEYEKARPLVVSWSAQGLEWNKIAARLARRGFSSRTLRSLREDDIK